MSSQKGFKRFLQSLIGHPSAAETAESELPEKETIETSKHTEIKAEEPAEPSLFDEMDAGGELPPLKGRSFGGRSLPTIHCNGLADELGSAFAASHVDVAQEALIGHIHLTQPTEHFLGAGVETVGDELL